MFNSFAEMTKSLSLIRSHPARLAVALSISLVLVVALAWRAGLLVPAWPLVDTSVLMLAELTLLGAVVATTLAVIWPRQSHERAFLRLYGDLQMPAYLTALNGQVLAQNECASALTGANRVLSLALRRWSKEADQIIYRMGHSAMTGGQASMPLNQGRAPHTLSVQAVGKDALVWTVSEGQSGPQAEAELPVPVVHLNRSGEVTGCNPAADALPEAVHSALRQAVTEGSLTSGRILMPAGDHGPYRAHLSPLPMGGEVVVLLACDPDELLGQTPDDLLFDLPVGLARINADGTLISVNAMAKRLLGDMAVEGRPFSSLLEGLGRPISERLSHTLKGRALGRSEIARGQIDDREVFLQVSLTRIVIDGEPSLLAVISDATELKTLEAQFVQSQKMQAVGQLAGGVAHDFNNLLTAIRGNCELLLMRHDAGDPSHGDLQQIYQNAARAAGLVRQLLAFSRKQTLRPRVLHLPDVLDELAHLLNRLLGAKVSLSIRAVPDLWPVRVDERQFEQVIVNLAVNARDAMPEGGQVRIQACNVSLEAELKRDRATVLPGNYVLIEVADTGVGIQPDKIGKIFEPFYTTKQVGEGTGLGLSTVYGIVKQTGGFIFCDSAMGTGTTFSIYLPQDEGEEAPQAPPERPMVPKDLSGRGTILLVEDEDPVRSFAARALELRGYSVIEAACGEDALDIVADLGVQIDLFVSDVIMPGLDGPSWVARALQDRPNTPTIFMSGYAEDVFAEQSSPVDGASFLAKPFSLTDLAEMVKDQMPATPPH
ncbi:MAG: ATP-binding protein [Pseudomonadota bacterium]